MAGHCVVCQVQGLHTKAVFFPLAGRHKQEIGKAITAAKSRFRSDFEQSRQAEADVVETAEYLEHAAHMALASLLMVCLHHRFEHYLRQAGVRDCLASVWCLIAKCTLKPELDPMDLMASKAIS